MQIEQTTDGLGEITNEQELMNYLNEDDNVTQDDDDNKKPEDKPEDKPLGDDLPETGIASLEGKAQEQPSDDDDTDDEKKQEEIEFSNIIEYIDKKHNLGLKIDQLPEDLDRAQEAEIVADLFEKVATNAERQINEFKEVAQLLEDQEVAAFLEAKRQGATLKDFLDVYSSSVKGMDDESVVKMDLKNQYPNMTDDEISELVDNYKDKGVLSKMAEASRTKIEEFERQKQEIDERQAQQEYEQSVKEVGAILQNTKEVYGVPLTEDIKKDVFIAATQRDPQTGMTYLDQALQSNEGVILATLGLLHMQDLMKANASINTNRRSKKLVEKLFEDPRDLQSNSPDNSDTPKFDPNAANAF